MYARFAVRRLTVFLERELWIWTDALFAMGLQLLVKLENYSIILPECERVRPRTGLLEDDVYAVTPDRRIRVQAVETRLLDGQNAPLYVSACPLVRYRFAVDEDLSSDRRAISCLRYEIHLRRCECE